jgi:hypothetical protein
MIGRHKGRRGVLASMTILRQRGKSVSKSCFLTDIINELPQTYLHKILIAYKTYSKISIFFEYFTKSKILNLVFILSSFCEAFYL